MLCRADIAGLARARCERHADKAVLVCKHDYVPKSERKFLDRVQTKYPRKNWSSLMLFNNERCRALTPGLRQLRHAGSSCIASHGSRIGCIGGLPLEWNWLVGEYAHNPGARIVHFTLGGPYFAEYRDCDYAAEWFAGIENRRGGT